MKYYKLNMRWYKSLQRDNDIFADGETDKAYRFLTRFENFLIKCIWIPKSICIVSDVNTGKKEFDNGVAMNEIHDVTIYIPCWFFNRNRINIGTIVSENGFSSCEIVEK